MIDDDRLMRSLRDAADPDLSEGADERIAAGAWERAASLRAGRPPRFRAVRRIGVAAAAAVLVAAAAFALHGTEAAFAVEGDPVMVQRGPNWVAAHDVPAGVVVKVPEGDRVLRSKAGDVFRPRPGSVFVCVAELDGSSPFLRVNFSEGGGDVDGVGVVVAMRNEVVVRRDPGETTFNVSFACDGGSGGLQLRVGAGRAVASSLVSGERLVLSAQEQATLLPISFRGATKPRLARLLKWGKDPASKIAAGSVRLDDADFAADGGITLVGGMQGAGLFAFQVPSGDVPDALRCVNGAAIFRAMLDVRVTASSPARYVYEKDALRVEVDVDACGAVVVRDASGVRAFPSVAAFRRADPAAAELFLDALPR